MPRLLNRFISAIKQKTKKLEDEEEEREVNPAYQESDYDHVLGKYTSLFGGRVRLILCGSAPLQPHVQNFARAAFACPVVQGYGQTESCGALSI